MKHFNCFPPAAYLGVEAQQTRGRVGCWCSGWRLALCGILHHTHTHTKYDTVPLNCESDVSLACLKAHRKLRRLMATLSVSCTMLLQALMLLSNAAGAGLFFAVKVEQDASAAISCWNGAP